jgi:hypothetical protein
MNHTFISNISNGTRTVVLSSGTLGRGGPWEESCSSSGVSASASRKRSCWNLELKIFLELDLNCSLLSCCIVSQ